MTKQISIAAEIDALLAAEKSYKEQMDARRKSLDDERELIRLLVKNGGATSGDRIRDFVLIVHDTLDEEVAAPYRRIEERLAGKKGQLFLVVQRREESNVKYVIAPRGGGFGGTHVVERRTMGLLAGVELVFELEPLRVMLPTDTTVEIDLWSVSKPQKGSFMPRSFFQPFDLISGRKVRGELECELIVGDDEVLAHPRSVKGLLALEHRNEYIALFYKAARILGKSLPEPREEKEFREFMEKKFLDKLRATWHEWHSTKEENGKVRLRDELEKLLNQALADEHLKNDEFVQFAKKDLD